MLKYVMSLVCATVLCIYPVSAFDGGFAGDPTEVDLVGGPDTPPEMTADEMIAEMDRLEKEIQEVKEAIERDAWEAKELQDMIEDILNHGFDTPGGPVNPSSPVMKAMMTPRLLEVSLSRGAVKLKVMIPSSCTTLYRLPGVTTVNEKARIVINGRTWRKCYYWQRNYYAAVFAEELRQRMDSYVSGE